MKIKWHYTVLNGKWNATVNNIFLKKFTLKYWKQVAILNDISNTIHFKIKIFRQNLKIKKQHFSTKNTNSFGHSFKQKAYKKWVDCLDLHCSCFITWGATWSSTIQTTKFVDEIDLQDHLISKYKISKAIACEHSNV